MQFDELRKLAASKADAAFNETVPVGHSGGGVKPRPIRKRGFHRALKRKELWAVCENSSDLLVKAAMETIRMVHRLYDSERMIEIIDQDKKG